jgi:aspartyl-tRNA(Asn)/glutamyl-tRNA(Gln) amidotransferase subunit C
VSNREHFSNQQLSSREWLESMSLTLDQVRKVAKLGRLELSDADLALMQQQLSAILDYVAQLNELDTTDVEPLAHPLPIENVFRPDEPIPSLSVDAALQNAPNRVGDYFGVPAVFDTDEPVSH